MALLIVVLLIVLNGVFAMAEMAIVSARRSRLKQMAEEGKRGSRRALKLAEQPNRFLSTVQIGITFVGIFAGAFGGERLADDLAGVLDNVDFLATYAQPLSLFIVVVAITYFSLIIGELVPKRLALAAPERTATLLARPMYRLSQLAGPLVTLLGYSTDAILKLLQVKTVEESPVSEEEMRLLIREGARMGVINWAEREIVERTFLLNDKRASALMTPETEIDWLDVDSSFEDIRQVLANNPHSHYPVCQGSLEKVVGVIRADVLLTYFLNEGKIKLEQHMREPIFVPETMDGLKILELFKQSGIHVGIVVDEYGDIEGMVTLADILEAIVGDIPTIDEDEEDEIVEREDGSFLVDGLVSVDEFKEHFDIEKMPEEDEGLFDTVGGYVMHKLEHVPEPGDHFKDVHFRFEVMDMDGNRVDKVLVEIMEPADEPIEHE